MKKIGVKEYLLTQEDVKARLTYNQLTGIFIWRVIPITHPAHHSLNNRLAGKEAGGISTQGYRCIGINGTLYSAHRIAWLYVTGSWPVFIIDHIDGNPLNNRFVNLREANHKQNAYNAKVQSNNTSGVTGVLQGRNGISWHAYIMFDGISIRLGTFYTLNDAVQARLEAEVKYYGIYNRENRYI